MGSEMCIRDRAAGALIEIAKSFGVEAQIIGRCESSSPARVTINSEHGDFEYSNS